MKYKGIEIGNKLILTPLTNVKFCHKYCRYLEAPEFPMFTYHCNNYGSVPLSRNKSGKSFIRCNSCKKEYE